MVSKTVGKLDSWDSGDVGDKTSFVNLEEGSNMMRCVSSPYQFYIHWVKDASGQTRKVHCCMKDCPVCARGETASPRWYVAVLNRKTNAVGVLEVGPQIFKGIKELTKKPKWGDPRAYDIDITRNPKGSQPLYSISPEPKEPLTDEEKTMIRAAMEKIDLSTMIEPPTADDIREKLGIEVVAKKAAVVPETQETSDDMDFDFDSK